MFLKDLTQAAFPPGGLCLDHVPLPASTPVGMGTAQDSYYATFVFPDLPHLQGQEGAMRDLRVGTRTLQMILQPVLLHPGFINLQTTFVFPWKTSPDQENMLSGWQGNLVYLEFHPLNKYPELVSDSNIMLLGFGYFKLVPEAN